ncbi:MAG: helix-turn-helix domain-containing protein [Candidatus Hermodarchaeota archaeon]
MLINDFHNLYIKQGLDSKITRLFQEIIYSYYKQHGRNFPFRKNITPYYVLVSELMLQQTQTGIVTEKFQKFIKKFPDFKTLAEAPNSEVLKAWQGLGYNRRAIALKKISKMIIKDYDGKLPQSIEILKSFPQIGYNTACSIYTFTYNKPSNFIETNIRRVYIYFFFPKKRDIKDKEILPLVDKTMDKSNPRKWFYALMDYGVMLKKTYPDLNKRSAHYRKQKPFKGSNREIRGKILKLLLENSKLNIQELKKELKIEQKKLQLILKQLEKEGFVQLIKNSVAIKEK